MRYFYLIDDNEIVKLRDDGTMWVLKSDGTWVEDYAYGGIFSGDVKCTEISRNELPKYTKK